MFNFKNSPTVNITKITTYTNTVNRKSYFNEKNIDLIVRF